MNVYIVLLFACADTKNVYTRIKTKKVREKTPGLVTYLTHSTMISGLHMMLALVTGIDKPILTLVVKLTQHAEGRELGPTQGGELIMPLPGHGEEGITSVHQVTGDQWVWIVDLLVVCSLELDDKEDLLKRTIKH